ncbi:hypothetical protein HL658_22045 [Azospirillum sp. RWY-5-1]|uniref:Uncharacterized protein n=1 Tax=Azospirillum oleiclasticum TaxID=2735135 RepID=A0ABX2TE94_9PROT|nr:hypothetical protein [Azospirillum oleiclasticum]NYZ15230.1 hypothetical protein [Azospirillum oleiclasticum]NYZ21349.1 hypothetical protein [Azospirillum oleiclasticum]
MDRSDQILTAIETLGRTLNAKIESTAAELRAELRAEIGRLEAAMKTEFRVVNARLDEQRQTINAPIPQRIAAVGRIDAAEWRRSAVGAAFGRHGQLFAYEWVKVRRTDIRVRQTELVRRAKECGRSIMGRTPP